MFDSSAVGVGGKLPMETPLAHFRSSLQCGVKGFFLPGKVILLRLS